MDRFGHCTVTVSEALPLPSLPDVKLAVLGYVPQLSAFVPLVMWTVSVTPEASVLKKLVSTPLLIDQAGVAGLLAMIPQVTPEPVGNRSLTLTLLAAPGPVLLSVTVNPICWPALTVDASAA